MQQQKLLLLPNDVICSKQHTPALVDRPPELAAKVAALDRVARTVTWEETILLCTGTVGAYAVTSTRVAAAFKLFQPLKWPLPKSFVQGHLLSSKAIVRQTKHFWAHSSKRGLAVCLCSLQGGCWTIVDVRPVSSCDGRLSCKQQLRAGWYALCTNTLPNRKPIVIRRVAVKVPAMPILTRARVHRNLPIDVFIPC